jgi:riboflavin kinase/FMN adenylyltransferase
VRVYQGIEEFEEIENAVVTTGTFDGVHIGHQTILNRLREVAERINGETVLLTFFPHPRMVLQSAVDIKLINTIEEKTDLLRKAGVDHLIIHPFTKAFSRTSSLEFVRDILVNRLGTRKLVIGYDHHFGRNREGSFEHLKEFGPLYGFEVEEISAQDIDNVNVSSTKIRNAILQGDMITANEYLGHPFQLCGKVIHGKKLGRELGYPTANLHIPEKYKLIPANGVYAVKSIVRGELVNGMLNIGTRPTIEEAGGLSIETHLFDFDGDIYGEEMTVQLLQRIRDEKKFADVNELIEEMKKDQDRVLSVLE